MGPREIGIGTLALGKLNRRTIKGNPHFRRAQLSMRC